jgi:hypothetical protein
MGLLSTLVSNDLALVNFVSLEMTPAIIYVYSSNNFSVDGLVTSAENIRKKRNACLISSIALILKQKPFRLANPKDP